MATYLRFFTFYRRIEVANNELGEPPFELPHNRRRIINDTYIRVDWECDGDFVVGVIAEAGAVARNPATVTINRTIRSTSVNRDTQAVFDLWITRIDRHGGK